MPPFLGAARAVPVSSPGTVAATPVVNRVATILRRVIKQKLFVPRVMLTSRDVQTLLASLMGVTTAALSPHQVLRWRTPIRQRYTVSRDTVKEPTTRWKYSNCQMFRWPTCRLDE